MKWLLISVSALLIGCSSEDSDLSAGIREIVETGESSLFVNVGDAMNNILTSKKDQFENCHIVEKTGDLDEPSGDGTATNVVLIVCASDDEIAIRVRKSRDKKYQILGFATIK